MPWVAQFCSRLQQFAQLNFPKTECSAGVWEFGRLLLAILKDSIMVQIFPLYNSVWPCRMLYLICGVTKRFYFYVKDTRIKLATWDTSRQRAAQQQPLSNFSFINRSCSVGSQHLGSGTSFNYKSRKKRPISCEPVCRKIGSVSFFVIFFWARLIGPLIRSKTRQKKRSKQLAGKDVKNGGVQKSAEKKLGSHGASMLQNYAKAPCDERWWPFLSGLSGYQSDASWAITLE